MDARLTALGAALAALLLGRTAAALELAPLSAPGTMVAKGPVVKGDAERLAAYLDRQKPRPSTIYLVSGGGLAYEGMALGTLIRERGLATRVGRQTDCASACVLAFLGGIIREVEPGARVGVHMASMMRTAEYIAKLKEILTRDDGQVSLDRKIQFIVAINEQHGAQIANAQAAYVLKMGVSLRLLEKASETLIDDIHWLTREELRDYNVVNTQ